MTTFNTLVNNASGSLASGYTAGSGSLVLTSGHGARFGSVFPIRVTVITAASYHTAAETQTIFNVTGRSTDTLTGVSIAEGSTDRNYSASDIIEMRWTAGEANALSTATKTLETAVAGMVTPNQVTVLRLPTGSHLMHVDHGQFWPQGTPLPDHGTAFWWDAWVKPFVNGVNGYLISAGAGGSHELLWGFLGTPGAITGNIWNGTGNTSFGGHYVVNSGEWVNMAVAWNGTKIFIYVNGVLDGIADFPGPRKSSTAGAGPSNLFVGGSDHDNMPGDLAFIRGWDTVISRNSGNLYKAYVPERYPSLFDNALNPCDFAADYTVPSAVVQDLSPIGFASVVGGPRVRHPGMISVNHASLPGPDYGSYYLDEYGDVFTSSFVADPTCPYRQPYGSPAPNEAIPAPRTPPPGCKIFDSFGRANQTFAFQDKPSLGSTEGGSRGPQVWSQGNSANELYVWGILQGAAVLLKKGQSVAWVDTGSADMDVRIDRFAGTYNPGRVALAFRVVDKDHYCFVQVSDQWNVGIYTMSAGTPTYISGWGTLPGSWDTLRAVAAGTSISVYADATLIGTATSSTYQSATKAGIQWGLYSTSDWDSLIRFKNFTVF